jgi:tetratricopeptide (TPR) repeat protein
MAEGSNQRPVWFGHRLYREAIDRFEAEEWDEAASLLSQLAAEFPGDPELEQILASLRLKASLGQEQVSRGRSWLRRVRRRALSGLGVLAILVLVAALGRTLYVRWLVPTWAARDQLIRVRELHQLARGYMAAGEYMRAVALYGEILDKAPEDDAAIAGLQRAEQLQSLADEYDRALRLTQEERWWEALGAWRMIRARDPNFRDADYWLAFVKRQDDLHRLFREAEARYAVRDCKGALGVFERLRSESADYQEEEVETMLAGCLVSMAKQKLWETDDPLSVRDEVIELFEKAVQVRPGNQFLLAEGQVAEAYLDSHARLQPGCEEELQELCTVYDPEADTSPGQRFLVLYQLNVSCGDQLAATRDFQGARWCYVAAMEMPVDDVSEARDKYAALVPMLTPTATATPRPPTPIPTPHPATPTPTHTATVSPWPYAQLGAPVQRWNDKNQAGCYWLGVGGQVFDPAGAGLPGVIVRVWSAGWEGSTSVSGQEDEYGAGGWEVYLDNHPKDGVWSCQVIDASGVGISPVVTFQTYAGDCSRNLVLINFKHSH